MTHDIELNLKERLKFRIVSIQLPELVSRVEYSPVQGRFIDTGATTDEGFVEVTSHTDEHLAVVNGQRVYDNLTFSLTLEHGTDGTVGALWDVYSFSDTQDEEVDLEEVATSDIPAPIVDMLPPRMV